jgi:hypothetical protein
MEAICSSETSVDTHHTTRRYVPEDSTLHNHRCENLKSDTMGFEVLTTMTMNSIFLGSFAVQSGRIPEDGTLINFCNLRSFKCYSLYVTLCNAFCSVRYLLQELANVYLKSRLIPTIWKRDLREKLIVSQLVKIVELYATRWSVNVLTGRHWTVS